MIWGCFNDDQIGNLAIIKRKLTCSKYVELLQENLFSSMQKFERNSSFVFQQDNDPKYTSRVAKEFFLN